MIRAALLAFAAFTLVACPEETTTTGADQAGTGQPGGGQAGMGQDAAVTPTPEARPGNVAVAATAVEYEFQGVPNELTSGKLTFRLENAGQEPHELVLSRITTEATVEELLELPESEVQEQLENVGRASAAPGQSDFFRTVLEPGRYGYVCFVESPDGTPHAFLGMRGEITVA